MKAFQPRLALVFVLDRPTNITGFYHRAYCGPSTNLSFFFFFFYYKLISVSLITNWYQPWVGPEFTVGTATMVKRKKRDKEDEDEDGVLNEQEPQSSRSRKETSENTMFSAEVFPIQTSCIALAPPLAWSHREQEDSDPAADLNFTPCLKQSH